MCARLQVLQQGLPNCRLAKAQGGMQAAAGAARWSGDVALPRLAASSVEHVAAC
jgi:hypothetical protein